MKKIFLEIKYKIYVKLFLYSCIILIIAYFTYFKNYYLPPYLFWDEGYHIASSEKYLNRIMFMEPHPPLGKLFIALGEFIFNPNGSLNIKYFFLTDKLSKIPKGYSFKGVRFFSTFFAALASILFFYILYFISKEPFLSFLFTSFYLFENAFIVHSRSAMLEGSQIFFMLLAILYFIYLIQRDGGVKKINYFYLGLLISFSISIKINSAILFLLFIFLLYYDLKERKFNVNKAEIFNITKDVFIKIVLSLTGILIIFFLVWYIHFLLGKRVLYQSYYGASDTYKKLIKQEETYNIKYFFLMLKDNYECIKNYEKGVPPLNVTDNNENGSQPITWPLGIKSINYRWDRDGDRVRYLYLQGNPAIWFTGLFAVLLSLIFIVVKYMWRLPVKNEKLFYFIKCFTFLYISYMITVLQVKRVLYLYHYFIPLIFALILAFILFDYFFKDRIKNKIVYLLPVFIVLIIIWTYCFYSPLTYYMPLSKEEFVKRAWFDFWQLKYVK